MAWKEGTRRLREIGRSKDLEKAEFDQIPCIIDEERKLRFSVVNTDDGTAIEERTPQNRSKKGPGTERATNDNQGSFFNLLDEPEKIIPLSRAQPVPGIIVSWFLLVYCDGDKVRAELSCPKSVDSGYFTDFYECIDLTGPGKGEGDGVRRRLPGGDDGPEFDIPVRRK